MLGRGWNLSVVETYFSMYGSQAGSESSFEILSPSQRKALIMTWRCFTCAMQDSRKCRTVPSFLLHAGHIGDAAAPMSWRCRLSRAWPVRNWIKILDWCRVRPSVNFLSWGFAKKRVENFSTLFILNHLPCRVAGWEGGIKDDPEIGRRIE